MEGVLKPEVELASATGRVRGVLVRYGLASVCEEARCPNRLECFGEGAVTFLLMGRVCTRSCRFCGVPQGGRMAPPDPAEPEKLAGAVRALGLRYVVLTAVTRDDLPDGGAAHLAACVRAVKAEGAAVELLAPDLRGDRSAWGVLLASGCDVLGHNIETVRRLAPWLRPQASHERSLEVLRLCGRSGRVPVKSGFMVGLGETWEEAVELVRELAGAGVGVLTVGQYLRPGKGKAEVVRFWSEEEFAALAEEARRAGIGRVVAGGRVRSSYGAGRD